MEETSQSWNNRHSVGLTTGLRAAFGLVWVVDGLMKFVFMQPSDVTSLVQGAGQGQPGWLAPWFSFWASAVGSAPSAYLYGIGAIELVLGVALMGGFLRKIAYVGGAVLAFMIWAIDEGFGGPYGPGATDIGAAVMYIFVFAALLIMETAPDSNKYTLDRRIEGRFNGWTKMSEVSS